MTRETAQNANLDFEQMMGELAAMKSDLASRQASRVGPRSTASRATPEGEPRRTRVRRVPTEVLRTDPTQTVDTAALDASTATHITLLSPTSPVTQKPAASLVVLQDADQNSKQDQIKDSASALDHTQDQSQDAKNSTSEGQQSQGRAAEVGSQPLMNIGAALNDSTSSTSSITAQDSLSNTPGAQLKTVSSSSGTSAHDSSPAAGAMGASGLVRSESRRNAAAPLPPKSAQRSRSISHGSSRLSQTIHNENNNDPHREHTAMTDGTSVVSHEVSTPTFGPTIPPRKSLRPYPSSPSLPVANAQMTSAAPRLPVRSNSRNYSKPTASTPNDHTAQSPPHSGPAPAIPSRSRSGSKSLSRSNTLTRLDGGHDQGSSYMGTPPIAEDQETSVESSQPIAPQQSSSEQQQGVASSGDVLQNIAAANAPNDMNHIRKTGASNNLGSLDETPGPSSYSPDPSLLPAASILSSSPSLAQPQQPEAHDNDNESQNARPALRKQKSADPAAMYHQHQLDTVHDRQPSRRASERRPNRDRNQSNTGNPALQEFREGSSRSKEPSGDIQQSQDRGRSQKKEEGSSKGGMFAWVRSRSKSKDASSSRRAMDTTSQPPVPEQPSYPEYNPALIPNRSGSQRAKSLPRKASNQNFHGNSDAWPPYSPGILKGDPLNPSTSAHQRNKSTSKPGLNPPAFTGISSTGAASEASSHPTTSLNVSTNMNKVHHENMIRGMGMGSTAISPAVLLTPQPSFPTTASSAAPTSGGMRNIALAMMKDDKSSSASEQQMQQRYQQLQQAQMHHLQQQQQRLAASVATSTSPPATPTSPRQQTFTPQGPLSPSINAPPTQRLVATRIYIQTETDFKSVNLAPNSTALDVLHMLQERGCFGEPGDARYHDRWTIFEYSKEFLIDRPLRDFEVVLDVMKTWEADKDNKMICKSFPARDELSAQEIVRLVGPAGQASFVRPHGWVHVEIKKGKWVKRYLHINDMAVYHSKDAKFSGESMLCMLRNFDVYAVQVPRKKAPTKFGFALKSSDSVHLFETPEDDYIHYVCTDSGESLREWLAGLRAAKGMFMYHANPDVIREGVKHAAELQSSGNANGMAKGSLTEEQTHNRQEPGSLSAETTSPTTNAFYLAPSVLNSAPHSPLLQSSFSQTDQYNTTSYTDKTTSPRTPLASTTNTLSSANLVYSINTETMPATTSPRNPFMAGSLLQQRVDAEKQEVENMKQQLKLREQAGVLGARSMNDQLLQPTSPISSSFYQNGGQGRGLSSTTSTAPTSSANTAFSLLQQQQQQQQPKFGGPGTLIEQGEARAAQLLERSRSVGTGLLRPSNTHDSSSKSSSSRSRSKSRGPPEDRHYQGQSASSHSLGSVPKNPPVPQAPLLQFADPNAMIKPGLLLDRAKSSKQASSANLRSDNHHAYASQSRSPGRHGGSSQNLTGQNQKGGQAGRTRNKPLIDLGNINTNRDMSGPGHLTGTTPAGSQSAKSPRRVKPLLEF
ncbi:hypothetical protein BGZ51_009036 [Haplosporangium sp. Z 767]|nr:hypothetical protein BGZ51_009036 [Haplosporangium sp. Z 767]KAF9196465.1 hypothetical protein BGZ50_000085 [Haplosporangium sp. Z 11]